MQELKTAIANFLKKAGLEKGVSQNNALLIWKETVGEQVSQNTAPEKVESGTLYVFADAAATLTLPDSGAGDIIGCTFSFISNFQGTGQKVVCSDTGNEDMVGVLLAGDNDDDNATKAWVALVGDAFASINMNSVAQGHPGSQFTVTNIAADVWKVEGVMIQSGGSEATPFANT